MQTITLHLRSSLKQRNSYALGESVETESHHQEGMAEWLCNGLQIHLPWFDSKYPLQHINNSMPKKKFGYIHQEDDTPEDKKEEHNEFELALRFLGNELIAIKMAATNFSGKLIVWSILLLLFSFMVLEVFGLSAMLGYGMEE